MVIQFTLQGFMIFLACAVAIVAGILLLPILWNLKKLLGTLHQLVLDNKESVDKTIKTMPGTFENIGQISTNVKEITDKLKVSVPVILQGVEFTTNAAKESIKMTSDAIENVSSGINETVATYKKDTSALTTYIHIIEEVIQIITRTFSKNKK